MMQRMQKYALERPEKTKNDLLETITRYKPAGSIMAAVSEATGATLETNQARRISSTHTAITMDDVRVGDRFGGYVVDFVTPGRVYSQLSLTREEALP